MEIKQYFSVSKSWMEKAREKAPPDDKYPGVYFLSVRRILEFAGSRKMLILKDNGV